MLDPATVFDDSGPLEEPLTDEVLRTVEAELGHRLPTAYVALARRHNGGSFARDAHPAPNHLGGGPRWRVLAGRDRSNCAI